MWKKKIIEIKKLEGRLAAIILWILQKNERELILEKLQIIRNLGMNIEKVLIQIKIALDEVLYLTIGLYSQFYHQNIRNQIVIVVGLRPRKAKSV